MFTTDVDAADIVGGAGFDAVILDREHTPTTLERVVEQLRAVRAAGDASVLVRVRRGDAAEISVLLDNGVEGLLLPDVRSVDAVEDAVRATRYPPLGNRGAHFTVSRAADWGRDAPRSDADQTRDVLVIPMIESVEGVELIPALARVEGVALVFFGPLDLSASARAMGRWDAPEYRSLLARGETLASQHGVAMGGALAPPGDLQTWFDRGHALVSVGSDVTFMLAGIAGSPHGNAHDRRGFD